MFINCWETFAESCGMEEIMREVDYGRIGMRIRQVRKAKGWSQDELAQKCGISMSFLGHIERGTRIMSLETFAAVCEALGIGADELLWGTAQVQEMAYGMWNSSGGHKDSRQDVKEPDPYAMYIRIMKSVADIMNEV